MLTVNITIYMYTPSINFDTTSYKESNSYRNKEFDNIANTLLKSKGNCKIVGSYVYKRYINGYIPNDIDCVCQDFEKATNDLEKYKSIRDITSEKDLFEYQYTDNKFKKLKSEENNIEIDISSNFSDNYNKNTFKSIPILTKNGLEHKDGSDIMKNHQLNFVVENLKLNSYCPWSEMRPKDIEYFKHFTEIDKNLCKGFYL